MNSRIPVFNLDFRNIYANIGRSVCLLILSLIPLFGYGLDSDSTGYPAKAIYFSVQPDDQYCGSGPLALSDKKKGGLYFLDGNWLGFQGTDVQVVVDLGKRVKVREIGFTFLSDPLNWIYPPTSLKVEISKNGTAYFDFFEHKFEEMPAASDSASVVSLNTVIPSVLNGKYRFVRIAIRNIGKNPPDHKYAGGFAWLFMDEIVIR